MRYHLPTKPHPFPYYEVPLFAVGSLSILSAHALDLSSVAGASCTVISAIFLFFTVILFLARFIWDDQPVSDHTLCVLRDEASRFSFVSNKWHSVCGSHRRPSWHELEAIIDAVNEEL